MANHPRSILEKGYIRLFLILLYAFCVFGLLIEAITITFQSDSWKDTDQAIWYYLSYLDIGIMLLSISYSIFQISWRNKPCFRLNGWIRIIFATVLFLSLLFSFVLMLLNCKSLSDAVDPLIACSSMIWNIILLIRPFFV